MEKLMNAYKELSKSEKRNQLSNELKFISEIINHYINVYGEFDHNIDIKNYDPKTDDVLSEDDILVSTYKDVFTIQKNLLLLMSIIENKNSK